MNHKKDMEMDIKRNTAEEFANKKRGEVIDLAIKIENSLTDIIAWCFYPSKYSKNEIISDQLDDNGLGLKLLILCKLTFHEKIDVLKDVITAKKPIILKNHNSFINTIVEELGKVCKFRNLLAHSESDLSREFIDGSVNYDNSEPISSLQVIEYKRGKLSRHLINRDRYVSEMTVMFRVDTRLSQLFSLLNDDQNMADFYQQMISKYMS